LVQSAQLVGQATGGMQSFSLDPKGSYIFANTNPTPGPGVLPDFPDPPLILKLSDLGIKAGDTIVLAISGTYSYSCYPSSCPIIPAPFACGVFSSSATLLGPTNLNRVTGAIAPDFSLVTPCVTPPTLFDQLPTDIPQDFYFPNGSGAQIPVPVGAAYLFLALDDSFYSDNADPNGNLAVQIQLSTVTLSRQSLTVVQATGKPSGGTFAYSTTPVSGSNFAGIDFASGVSASDNPNLTNLTDPDGNGAPTPGGLESVQAQYTVNGSISSDSFQVPTFGMSCYMIALESDYGTPPNACLSTTIYGVHYTGALTNPNGLIGTYCASFIGNVYLQGSAQLNSGQDVQYNKNTTKIVPVSVIRGSDGTPVVAGQTVARDKAIIPAKKVLVDVDQVGSGLLANDTGSRIVGYRLDLFNGAGKAACDDFENPIAVAACSPAQGKCPGSALK